MTSSSVDHNATSRPGEPLRPPGDRAWRALEALDDERLDNAAAHLDSAETQTIIDRAWKLTLEGCLAHKRASPAQAERSLLMALGLTWVTARGPRDASDGEAHRLAALAMGVLGDVYRRQERFAEAVDLHDAAYAVALSFGSHDELWELATQRGLDATVQRQHDEALRFHDAALSWSEHSAIHPARKRAASFAHRSAALSGLERYEEAVDAARESREHWRNHDVGSRDAARADLVLGSAILSWSTQWLEQNDSRAEPLLDEAMTWLTQARDSLPAFGSASAADVESCQDQLAFAEQVRTTMLAG